LLVIQVVKNDQNTHILKHILKAFISPDCEKGLIDTHKLDKVSDSIISQIDRKTRAYLQAENIYSALSAMQVVKKQPEYSHILDTFLKALLAIQVTRRARTHSHPGHIIVSNSDFQDRNSKLTFYV